MAKFVEGTLYTIAAGAMFAGGVAGLEAVNPEVAVEVWVATDHALDIHPSDGQAQSLKADLNKNQTPLTEIAVGAEVLAAGALAGALRQTACRHAHNA